MVFSVVRRLRYIYGTPSSDNFIFQLFYRWTVLLLLAFSFIVTCRLLFGDSFECANNYGNPWTVYCYGEGVYTLPAKLVIENDDKGSSLDPSAENFRRYQMYYPWVNLLFLDHAFQFYLPHLLWNVYERGYVCRLTAGVQKFFDREGARSRELRHLANYFLATLGKHKRYTGIYIFFEAWNCANSISLTLVLIYFFNITGVPHFLPNVIATWSDFKHFYFSPNGLCEWRMISTSGVIQRMQAMCQLPLNSLYMWMFLILHTWYVLLAVLGGLVLVYRIVLLVSSFRVRATKISSPLCDETALESLCGILSYGDWFFLSRLQKTMTDVDFAQMVEKISRGGDNAKEPSEKSLDEDVLKDLDSCDMTSVV